MADFFGDLMVKAIPFVLPALLVLSFLVNHKGYLPSGGGGEGDQKQKPAKKEAQQKSATPAPQKKEAPAPVQSEQQESLDAPISDEDMT